MTISLYTAKDKPNINYRLKISLV